jgi:hypothetical protein
LLHWDSNLIDDSHGTKYERLADHIEGKLFGVPSLVNGERQATSTDEAKIGRAMEMVRIWDLKKKTEVLSLIWPERSVCATAEKT